MSPRLRRLLLLALLASLFAWRQAMLAGNERKFGHPIASR